MNKLSLLILIATATTTQCSCYQTIRKTALPETSERLTFKKIIEQPFFVPFDEFDFFISEENKNMFYPSFILYLVDQISRPKNNLYSQSFQRQNFKTVR